MSFAVPSSNHMLLHNNKVEYEEMRRRLVETEQKLRNLSKFEEELQSVTSVTMSSGTDLRAMFFAQNDSIQSGNDNFQSRSMVSDSSTRFSDHKKSIVHSAVHKQNHVKGEDSFESDSSSSSVCKLAAANKYERKLLCQNQRLLTEVERLVDELHTLKLKIASLEKYEALGKMVPDLEDKIEGLLAENEAQDKALSDAEMHIDEGAKINSDLQMKLDKLEGENLELNMELNTMKITNKETECQRDEALQNLMETQNTLDNYQHCMMDKIMKMETVEGDLRNSITNVTQERNDLIERLSNMQMSMTSQEAQINRLLNDLEIEGSKKQEVEKENKKLQEQFEALSTKLSKYESDSKDMKVVKKEKQLLEAELSEHRSMAQEIAELLMLVQHNHNKNVLQDGVGNSGTRNGKTELKMWPINGGTAVAELNVNNNGNFEVDINNSGLGCEGGVSMMGELRNLFINMDGEIQRLRYDLKQRDADDKTYQNLHDELKVLMERVESGVTSNQELSCFVSNLKEEKRNLLMKMNECQQIVAERERQIQLLDTHLNERNHQVVCLQEDNNEKAENICNMRKQIELLEQQVQQCGSGQNEVSGHLDAALSRIKELEEILCQKEMTIQDLNEQLVKLQKEFRCVQQKLEKKVDCLNQQVYEYEKQTEQLSAENENLRAKLGNCLKSCEDCRRLLQNRENQVLALEAQLEELKTTLEEKEKLHCKILESYQQKICKSNEQIKNLENALCMCRNEVKMHMETMEKIKNHFECEIMKRDACIKHLKEELRKCAEDLKCRANENCVLEQTNADLQNKLTNAFAQLKCCEQNANLLSEKLKNTENIMLKDKACYMKENEEMDRRLTQALNSLQCAHEEINKLKAALSEKSGMVDCLQGEKNSLCRDLAKCKEVACTLQDKLSKMEKDNQELCRQLQQKMDCIRDMEVALCSKEQEVKRCQRCVDELQEKIKRMLAEQNALNAALALLQEKLKCCREELFETGKRLSETEDCLKRCQLDVEDKCEIIRTLNCNLEEVSCRLHERVARVDELEKAIENLNKDIEKRMKRVDEQLKKYECELCDKAKQIADLDDGLSRCQRNLSEKCNEACVLEQKNTRLISDFCACSGKLKESEDARECLGKALAEQRAETAEVSQELRATREQLQQKHQEAMDCQQNLCCSNREWEKCRRDCDELRNSLAQRECELQHLNEEKNCLVSKVAHLTCRLESETCQLENQMAEMKCRLEKENEALRIYQTEVEENNACLLQKLGTCQRQLSQLEKCCTQKIDCMHREIVDLASKVADRDDQITQCKDCLAIRDSEIMRLKLKLCNTDSMCNSTCNNSNCSNYSTDKRFEPDNIGSPIVLSSSQLQERIPQSNTVSACQLCDNLNSPETIHSIRKM